jgi:hypothetical protein
MAAEPILGNVADDETLMVEILLYCGFVDVQDEELYRALKSSTIQHGASQWYDIGIALGYSHGEVESCTKDKKEDKSKIHCLINKKYAEVGRKEVIALLFNACKKIPSPIYGAVTEDVGQV